MSGCSALKSYRVAAYSGGLYGTLDGPDLIGEVQGLRLDVNANRSLGLDESYGRIELGLDLYGSAVFGPQPGSIIGATPMLRYSYPIIDWLAPYIEGGAGPAILSFPTHEQEKSGFSFNDQIGAGFEFRLWKRLSIVVGFRFGHLSHGGLRTTRNRGIETNTGVFGLTLEFP
jgi:opacity protein-like surface antigen